MSNPTRIGQEAPDLKTPSSPSRITPTRALLVCFSYVSGLGMAIFTLVVFSILTQVASRAKTRRIDGVALDAAEAAQNLFPRAGRRGHDVRDRAIRCAECARGGRWSSRSWW